MSQSIEQTSNRGESAGKGLRRVGAVLMFLGVGLGAFGAHGLKEILTAHGRVGTWETAVFYHLVHGLAVWVLGLVAPGRRVAGFCFVAGVLIFSGSLYLLCVTNIGWLGAITPIGGVFFLVGWGALAVKN